LDNELKGEGSSYDFGARLLDPRIGRWLSTDPLAEEFPSVSPYAYSFNSPIMFVDPDGRAPKPPSYFVNQRGFWIQGESSFGEYVGNVKPLTDRYMELTRIKGTLYHKNTNAWVKGLWNDAFGTNFVAKKAYSVEEETNNDLIRFSAEWAVTGIAFKAIGGIGGQLLKKAGGSIWKLPVIGPGARGFVYEEMLGLKGLMKSSNFPVIDAFYKGVATSVKTMDIFAKKYIKDGAVTKQLTKYVDDLANFKGRTWGDDVVKGSDIEKRVLEVGIPKGASEKIIEQINKVTEYAKTQGVELNVRVVK
jgi:RHS repeat-associated protein